MKTFLFPLLFLSSCTFAQSESLNYVFDSEVYKSERTVSVFLPSSYKSADSTYTFAVAYLFDCQFTPYYDMVNSMMSYYEETGEGIPLIVIGIHTDNRWDEFVPVCGEQSAENPEAAAKLSQFLEDEVIPIVESQYRVQNFRIGVGHSLGGSYVLYEAFKEKSLFNAVIAVSPNLTMCQEDLVQKGSDYFDQETNSPRFFYTSIGTIGNMENGFSKSLLRLDSLIETKTSTPNFWTCNVLEEHNHMTTFIPTFNAGYLALSSKLFLSDDALIQMAGRRESETSMYDQLTAFYAQREQFAGIPSSLTLDELMRCATTLGNYGESQACIDLCNSAKKILSTETHSPEKKKEISELIETRLERASFNLLAKEAAELANKGRIKEAAERYQQAFDMGLIRATHHVRIAAVPVLAQAGNIEEAFKQLELLANRFELGGNGSFINDPLCSPLHSDKRWQKYMDKLEKNGDLYR